MSYNPIAVNQYKYDYTRFEQFCKAMQGYEYPFGTLHLGYVDLYTWHATSSPYHGDKSHLVVYQIMQKYLPNVDVEYHKLTSFKQAEEARDRSELDLLNVSMSWDSQIEEAERLARKGVIIFGSLGNDWIDIRPDNKQARKYPGMQNKCIGVGACDLRYPYTDDPHMLGYSNEIAETDKCDVLANFTNIFVQGLAKDGKYIEDTFGGTSCSSPYTEVTGAVLFVYYAMLFKRKPSYSELQKYLFNSAKDLKQDGWDERSGFGVPILFDNHMRWYDVYDYFNLNVIKYNSKGEIIKYKMFDLGIPFKQVLTRGDVWLMYASLMGMKVSSRSERQMNKAFEYVKDIMNLFANNANDPIAKRDFIVVMARYLAIKAGLVDSDKDGIADILDVDYKEVGIEEYYQIHIDYMEEFWNLVIYDTSEEAMIGNVTYEVGGTLTARVFGFTEKLLDFSATEAEY